MIANKNVLKAYQEAHDKCILLGQNEAWVFEQFFAEIIAKQCAELARDNASFFSRPHGKTVYDIIMDEFKSDE